MNTAADHPLLGSRQYLDSVNSAVSPHELGHAANQKREKPSEIQRFASTTRAMSVLLSTAFKAINISPMPNAPITHCSHTCLSPCCSLHLWTPLSSIYSSPFKHYLPHHRLYAFCFIRWTVARHYTVCESLSRVLLHPIPASYLSIIRHCLPQCTDVSVFFLFPCTHLSISCLRLSLTGQ